MLLNTSLNGMSIEEINLGMIARLKEQAGVHSEVISDVLDAVGGAIQLDDDLEIYTSGATNIFKYPELSDKLLPFLPDSYDSPMVHPPFFLFSFMKYGIELCHQSFQSLHDMLIIHSFRSDDSYRSRSKKCDREDSAGRR